MNYIKHSIAVIALTAFFSLTISARQIQIAPSDSTKNLTLKDKWAKHYNDINVKLDGYRAKLKTYGNDHGEFTDALNKLDKMMAEFKEEIEKWDHATKDQRAKYSDALKEDFKELKAQEEKVSRMWSKLSEEMKKNSGGQG